MNIKLFSNRVMTRAGVQTFSLYFVGAVNDPVKFMFATGYEVDQTISHRIREVGRTVDL